MKMYKLLITSLLLCSMNVVIAQGLGIIPEPYLATKGKGTYTLPKTISISAPSSLKNIVDPMIAQLKLVTGKTVNLSKNEPTIELSLVKDDVIGNEGYLLNVNEKGIQVKANTEAGIFYGWQTVQQLMPAAIYGKTLSKNTNWELS
ncbi:MAG: glycoside hydrolase family 20 zincin-like fold domain-containing protein, partial [Sediminibacterium sp.]